MADKDKDDKKKKEQSATDKAQTLSRTPTLWVRRFRTTAALIQIWREAWGPMIGLWLGLAWANGPISTLACLALFAWYTVGAKQWRRDIWDNIADSVVLYYERPAMRDQISRDLRYVAKDLTSGVFVYSKVRVRCGPLPKPRVVVARLTRLWRRENAKSVLASAFEPVWLEVRMFPDPGFIRKALDSEVESIAVRVGQRFLYPAMNHQVVGHAIVFMMSATEAPPLVALDDDSELWDGEIAA